MTKTKNHKERKKNSSSANLVFWVGGIVIICIIGFIVLGSRQQKEGTFDYKNEPFIGDKAAKVNIVEFGDYKCPVCKNFNQDFFPIIKKKFVDSGQAKFYFMNYAFINVDSKRAAKFAETVYKELGNDTFWKFHHLLYEKQPDDPKYEKMDYFTDSFLEKTLTEVASKKDAEKVMDAYNNSEALDYYDKDMNYVKKLKINSTPTIFVNGKQFTGRTLDDLTEMVNKAEKGS
ncbi:DsbA family protein [Falsibacillus albus]|uniref:Thiol-disulfide oxidoreductase n=1 Tax=Falsibacillus albus TaxID=2478915 RepID=A0A3L7JZN2_9BACI|nr:thioredoxin domain-containing protein [Falsibacillus albus]RLQ96237.1 thiol-disulfide oxidoreductase [Falsibacillus albus]